MTKKRQASSSVVSVMEDETLDLNIGEDSVLESENDSINYMNVDISTDNIEDIVTSKMGDKVNSDDFYMMNMSDDTDMDSRDLEIPKNVAIDDPVRLYLDRKSVV